LLHTDVRKAAKSALDRTLNEAQDTADSTGSLIPSKNAMGWVDLTELVLANPPEREEIEQAVGPVPHGVIEEVVRATYQAS
jgi:hypothetical protein